MDTADPIVAFAFTRTKFTEASEELSTRLAEASAAMRDATTTAHAVDLIANRLLPALATFVDSCDRTSAFVDKQLASGAWQPHAGLAALRAEVDGYRLARDELAALESRAGDMPFDELMLAIAQAVLPAT